MTATIAGCLSFVLGKILLRKCVAKCVEKNKTFMALSNAFDMQGLKLNLLLRVNPIMPYMVLNYGECLTKGNTMMSEILGILGGICGYDSSRSTANVYMHIRK